MIHLVLGLLLGVGHTWVLHLLILQRLDSIEVLIQFRTDNAATNLGKKVFTIGLDLVFNVFSSPM